MKKISLIICLFFTGMTGILTSCSEDYPGPDPVDVTANYSNKFSNPNPNLTLTYSEENLTGKSIDFSTVKGETANILLYDILPGEKALTIQNVPLTGTDSEYAFSGTATGTNTGIQFHYDGKVKKGHLTFNLTDIQTAGASQWANKYHFSDITKAMSEEYEDTEILVTGAGFVDTKMPEGVTNYNSLLRSALAYFLPQVLNTVTLKADGNILVEYSTDALMINGKVPNMEEEGAMMEIVEFLITKLMIGGVTNEDVNAVTKDRVYLPSPTHLAYWYPADDQVRIKLNLPAVIALAMERQGQKVDENLLATLTNIIFTIKPAELKSILIKINETLQNSAISFIIGLDDTTFNTFCEWITIGIPMNIDRIDGHTHLYLDIVALQPILDMLPDLIPVITNLLPESLDEYSKKMLESILTNFFTDWSTAQKFNLGLDLVPNE